MSYTKIFTSCGQRARTSRILSSCSSFSAKKNRVPLSLTMYSTCLGESVV